MKPVVTVPAAILGDATYQEQWQDRAIHLASAVERIVLSSPCDNEKCGAWEIAYEAWKDYEKSFAEGVDFHGDRA